MSLPMLAISGVAALGVLTLTGLVAVAVSAMHSHDLTVTQFCRCWACLLAYRLDRHHGRHRQEELSILQMLNEADRRAL